MKLIDANILLYAYDRDTKLHDRARHWFEAALSDLEPVGFAPATIVAFVRIATSSQILKMPFTPAQACAVVDEWLDHPSTLLLLPTGHHWSILGRLVVDAQASGGLVADAHVAACAIEHGATLYTHDRDFTRFQGLHAQYPLLP